MTVEVLKHVFSKLYTQRYGNLILWSLQHCDNFRITIHFQTIVLIILLFIVHFSVINLLVEHCWSK